MQIQKSCKTIQELQQFFPDTNVQLARLFEQSIANSKTKMINVNENHHYSGKKKKHTVQNQITINLDGMIIHKSAHSPGCHHDYKIYKSKHPVLSKKLLQ